MAETCGTCRYAEPTIGDDANLFLACRRYPPALMALDGEPTQAFPNVAEADWCGEWENADDSGGVE